VADVQQKMWEKLVMLGTLAGMTTLMRTSVGAIATNGGAPLAQAMLDTNAEIAARNGYAMPAELLEGYRRFFADTSSPMTASMLRDMEKGGPVEADHIVGHLLGEARRLGIAAPLHEAAYVNLKAYEAGRVQP
jgi:2-dehydropantoate 2-reductase